MNTQGRVAPATMILGTLLAVACGVLAGMYFDNDRGAGPASRADPTSLAHAGHDHANHLDHANHAPALGILDAGQMAVIEGFTCNCQEPGCNFLPLSTCTCRTAQAMQKVVKRLLGEGQDRDQIAAALEEIWGDGIFPGGQVAVESASAGS